MTSVAENLLANLNIFGERAYEAVTKQIVTNLWALGILTAILILLTTATSLLSLRAYRQDYRNKCVVLALAAIVLGLGSLSATVCFSAELFHWTNNPDYVILKKLSSLLKP